MTSFALIIPALVFEYDFVNLPNILCPDERRIGDPPFSICVWGVLGPNDVLGLYDFILSADVNFGLYDCLTGSYALPVG